MNRIDATSSAQVIECFERFVIPNYKRYPVCLVRGEGSYVWDAEGNRYLDLFPGWGCNILGYSPPAVVQAIQSQVAELIHVPNTWYTEAQGQFAETALHARLRPGLFLQQRGRGDRSGHQAGPSARGGQALQDHHVRKQLSRPHAGRSDRHGTAEISRRSRPARRRISIRAAE